MTTMSGVADYLDLTKTGHRSLFEHEPAQPVWAAIGRIGIYLEAHLKPALLGSVSEKASVGEKVFLDEGAIVEPGAVIKGPAWIGKNTVVRSGAYVRENVIIGDHCTIGNSCEFKNCVLFDHCEVPHFNYVGDAILGYKAHLGAGVILSNVRLDRQEVILEIDGKRVSTGLMKFSAVVGDFAEIGCNSVINPGSLIGRRSLIYPCTSFQGVLSEGSILKSRQQHLIVPRH